MASSDITQDTELGVSAHKKMEEEVLSMQSRINDMTSAVTAVEYGWAGQGHDAFNRAADEWREVAQQLHSDLQDISEAMGMSVKTLDQADEQVTTHFTNLV